MSEFVFGTTSALTGWTLKSRSNNVTTSWDDGMDGEGFWTGSQSFDTKTEVSESYEADLADDVTAPTLGTVTGVCTTSVSMTKTAGAKATMSITKHSHAENSTANGSYSWDLSDYIDGSGWGCCTPPVGTAPEDGSILSWGITFNLQHEELNDCDGDHLNAESYGPTIECTVEVVGDTPYALVSEDVTAGWELVSTSVGSKSPGFTSSKSTFRNRLAKPVVTP